MSEPEILGTGQGALEGFSLVRGQHIRLNDQARAWTRGRTFYIHEVKVWGIICWTEAVDLPPDVHVSSRKPNQAVYPAPWAEIAGIL